MKQITHNGRYGLKTKEKRKRREEKRREEKRREEKEAGKSMHELRSKDDIDDINSMKQNRK